jgi:hypothetical protein
MNDACKKKNKHHNAQNNPIEAEDLKPVFLEVIYKEAITAPIPKVVILFFTSTSGCSL